MTQSYGGMSFSRPPDEDTVSVLHVDDQLEFAELAADFFEEDHDRFDVTAVGSGDEGLEVLSGGGIDCVVSDYKMSGMDGLEFLAAVREEYPDLPFILLTAKGNEDVASAAISNGVTDYLQKDVGVDQFTILANRIENAIDQRRAERRLEENQRRFRTLLSNVPSLVYRCRNERGWPMRFLSDDCVELTGYEPEALIEGDVSYGRDLVHPDDRDRVWNSVQDALASHEPFRIEYRIRTADGAEKWVWEQGQGVLEDGEVVALEGFITDVTERKRSQERLEYQSSLLEAMNETTIDGMLVIDEDRAVASYNDRLVEMWEIPEGLVEKRSDEALLDWVVENRLAEPESFLTVVEELYDHPDRTSRDEVRLTDGRVFDRYSAPVVGDDGTNYGRLWTFRDVTERMEREEQLQIYEYVCESALSAIAIVSLDGELREVNAAFCEMWGYEDDEELYGESVTDFWTDPEAAANAVSAIEETGSWEGELRGVREDGTTFDAHCTASEVTDEDGDPIALMSSFVDVTERNRQERELAEEREKYATVVEQSHDGIAIVQDAAFVFANPRLSDILGYGTSDLLEMSITDVLAPEDEELVQERYERRIDPAADSPPPQYTLTFETPDGQQRTVEVSAANIQYEDEPAILVSVRDVTERQRYEDELKRVNEELEVLNRVVRHDIRNDMAIILGWAELLTDHVDDAGRERLETILMGGEHVVELTEIARDYVETLTSEEAIDVEQIRFRPLLTNEITLRQEAYPDAEIVVEEPIPDVDVRANEMLSSVFRNLLNNAVQHNDKDSPVVEVTASERADEIEVAVADNGPGVPEAQREAIFGKGEVSLDSSGTGIGLYLVRTLIEQYGGDVRVEDNDPDGAVFTVTLPKADR